MDPAAAAAASSPSSWRRSVRRRAQAGGVEEEKAAVEGLGRRAEELEEEVRRLREEKEAAERGAAALRAELDAERGAAGDAASEAMLMIGRLQREKAAAMMEARGLRRVAEGSAGRDHELQDELAAVSAVAASYAALLRAHGVDPAGDESNHEDEDSVERVEANMDGENRGGDVEVEKPSPPPRPAEEEFVYTVDVRCAAVTKAVAEKRVVADVAGALCARVDALEADGAAVRREVAALRAERAQVVLAREVERRLCREAAAARAVVVAAGRPRFSVLAICKWFFTTILRGTRCPSSAARRLPNPGSSTAFLLVGLLPLLESSQGVGEIQKMPGDGEPRRPCSSAHGVLRWDQLPCSLGLDS